MADKATGDAMALAHLSRLAQVQSDALSAVVAVLHAHGEILALKVAAIEMLDDEVTALRERMAKLELNGDRYE